MSDEEFFVCVEGVYSIEGKIPIPSLRMESIKDYWRRVEGDIFEETLWQTEKGSTRNLVKINKRSLISFSVNLEIARSVGKKR